MSKYTINQKQLMSLSYIQSEFAKCDKLDTQYIKLGDKEPSWDGNLYLHKTNSLKANGVLQIPVQIKGTEIFDKHKMEVQIEVLDLENYKNHNGVLYLVVQINSDSDKELYYVDLLSPDIERILSKGAKSRVYVKLKKFDTSSADNIERILRKFAKTRMHMSSDDIYVENLELFDKIVVNYELVAGKIMESLFEEQIVFGKVNSLPNRLVPLFRGVLNNLEEPVEKIVSVNGVTYYSSFKRVRTRNGITVKIGNTLSIFVEDDTTKKVNEQKVKFTVNLNLERSFLSLYEDSKFVDAMISNNGFEMDGTFMKVPSDKDKFGTIENIISSLKDIKQLYTILNINDDFNFSELSDDDFRMLYRLVEYFVNNNHKALNFDRDGVWKVDISSVSLKFYVLNSASKKGPNLVNIFSDEISIKCSFEYADDVIEQHSYFLILKHDDLISLSNINFTRMYNEIIKEEKPSHRFIDTLTRYTLEVLHAYDITHKDNLLSFYRQLLDYRKNLQYQSHLEEAIYIINDMQYKIRNTSLSTQDKKELIELQTQHEETDESEGHNDILFAINVLLGNRIEAEEYFNLLNPDSQKLMMSYPIYNLY